MMVRLIGCSVLLLLLVGCAGKSDPNRPDTAPVTGVVTYKGQPVEGATVTFVATSQDGRGATGTTDASGKFTLLTFAPGDGAIPGSYGVKISKTSGGAVASTPEEAMKLMESGGGMPKSEPVKDLLPAKYKDEKTSGLKADVKEGDNNFPFDLTD